MAGIAVPVGELRDLNDPGLAVGAEVGYQINPRISIRVLGDADFLQDRTLSGTLIGPHTRLWHYTAGVAAHVLDPDRSRISILVSGGAGASTLDTDDFQIGSDPSEDFTETYFTADGGIRFGYTFSRKLSTFVGGQAFLVTTDKADTERLAAIDPTRLSPFSTAWTFPVMAGFTLRV